MTDGGGYGVRVRLVVVLDCADADALAGFWSSALGFRRGPYGAPYVRLTDPDRRWPDLLLQQVPEPKAGKNRIHWDVLTDDVGGLVARGATVLRSPDEQIGWTVMADPEGNEFCAFTD